MLPGPRRPAGHRLRRRADGSRSRCCPGGLASLWRTAARLAAARPRHPRRRHAGALMSAEAAAVRADATDEPSPAVVELDGIDKSFGGNVVLAGVQLAARPGFTGLIGPNGAGKTTCLNVISGLPATRPGRRPARRATSVVGLARRTRSPRPRRLADLPDAAADPEPVRGRERAGRRPAATTGAATSPSCSGCPPRAATSGPQRDRAHELLATFGLGATARAGRQRSSRSAARRSSRSPGRC